MAHQRADGCADFVGQIGRKLHQASVAIVQTVKHGVEGVAQLLQLDGRIAAVEAFVEAGRGDCGGMGGHSAQRTQAATQQHIPQGCGYQKRQGHGYIDALTEAGEHGHFLDHQVRGLQTHFDTVGHHLHGSSAQRHALQAHAAAQVVDPQRLVLRHGRQLRQRRVLRVDRDHW